MGYLFIGQADGESCIDNKYYNSILGDIYHYSTEILVFPIPFLSLSVMNGLIIFTLMKRSQQFSTESTLDGKGQKQKNTERQIIITLLSLTFAFLILNIPIRILMFYNNFHQGDSPYYFASLHLFFNIGEKCYLLSHGINFYLYVISGQKFRNDLKRLFCPKTTAGNNSSVVQSVITTSTSMDV